MELDTLKYSRKNRVKAAIKSTLEEHLKVENIKFSIVLEIPILFSGWECDEENYVVKLKNGQHLYINSNHGGLFVDESYSKHIANRLSAYKKSQTKLLKAKKLLKKP